jgi:hypothetical protein
METLSYIILLLLSLAGYSAGATSQAGKYVELKPQIIDLLVVVAIWTGGIFSRIALDLNKWLLIFIWVIISISIGFLAVLPRNLSKVETLSKGERKSTSRNFFGKLWPSWKNFSKRMGSFQSQILLSLFFFLFISPFALAMKMLSDPLKIKEKSTKSYWLEKTEKKLDIDEFKRQF